MEIAAEWYRKSLDAGYEPDEVDQEHLKAVLGDEAIKNLYIYCQSGKICVRTPINAVLGMNEMILRESARARDAGAASPANRDAFADITVCARNIESAGNNLLAIINDILDLSKIEAGKMDIVGGEYQLSSMLNDLSNMIFFPE